MHLLKPDHLGVYVSNCVLIEQFAKVPKSVSISLSPIPNTKVHKEIKRDLEQSTSTARSLANLFLF